MDVPDGRSSATSNTHGSDGPEFSVLTESNDNIPSASLVSTYPPLNEATETIPVNPQEYEPLLRDPDNQLPETSILTSSYDNVASAVLVNPQAAIESSLESLAGSASVVAQQQGAGAMPSIDTTASASFLTSSNDNVASAVLVNPQAVIEGSLELLAGSASVVAQQQGPGAMRSIDTTASASFLTSSNDNVASAVLVNPQAVIEGSLESLAGSASVVAQQQGDGATSSFNTTTSASFLTSSNDNVASGVLVNPEVVIEGSLESSDQSVLTALTSITPGIEDHNLDDSISHEIATDEGPVTQNVDLVQDSVECPSQCSNQARSHTNTAHHSPVAATLILPVASSLKSSFQMLEISRLTDSNDNIPSSNLVLPSSPLEGSSESIESSRVECQPQLQSSNSDKNDPIDVTAALTHSNEDSFSHVIPTTDALRILLHSMGKQNRMPMLCSLPNLNENRGDYERSPGAIQDYLPSHIGSSNVGNTNPDKCQLTFGRDQHMPISASRSSCSVSSPNLWQSAIAASQLSKTNSAFEMMPVLTPRAEKAVATPPRTEITCHDPQDSAHLFFLNRPYAPNNIRLRSNPTMKRSEATCTVEMHQAHSGSLWSSDDLDDGLFLRWEERKAQTTKAADLAVDDTLLDADLTSIDSPMLKHDKGQPIGEKGGNDIMIMAPEEGEESHENVENKPSPLYQCLDLRRFQFRVLNWFSFLYFLATLLCSAHSINNHYGNQISVHSPAKQSRHYEMLEKMGLAYQAANWCMVSLVALPLMLSLVVARFGNFPLERQPGPASSSSRCTRCLVTLLKILGAGLLVIVLWALFYVVMCVSGAVPDVWEPSSKTLVSYNPFLACSISMSMHASWVGLIAYFAKHFTTLHVSEYLRVFRSCDRKLKFTTLKFTILLLIYMGLTLSSPTFYILATTPSQSHKRIMWQISSSFIIFCCLLISESPIRRPPWVNHSIVLIITLLMVLHMVGLACHYILNLNFRIPDQRVTNVTELTSHSVPINGSN